MTGDRSAGTSAPRGLLIAVVLMTLVAMGLGAAIVILQLRPEEAPQTRHERLLQYWEGAVDANPNAGWAHAGLGDVLLQGGDESGARDEFEEAVQLDISQWLAWMKLGEMLTPEDPETAIQFLLQSVAQAPHRDKILPQLRLGDLYLTQGQLTDARESFERAISSSPEIIDGHLGLAQTLEGLDDRDGAIAEYRRVLDFDPNNADAEDALERLGAQTTQKDE